MNLTYEISGKGDGTVTDFPAAAITDWIKELTIGDFLILEHHEDSWVQVRRETEDGYQLEYLNESDGILYGTSFEIVDQGSVIQTFVAFANCMSNLHEMPTSICPSWVVARYQPEPKVPEAAVPDVNCSADTFIQHSNGYEFEEHVASTLQKAGWTTRLTKKSGDQGLDVLAFDDRYRVALQCKRYAAPVGNSAVQEAHAAADFIGASHAVLVATSGFTASAVQLGEALGVVLLGEDGLADIRSHLVFVTARPIRSATANLFR